MVTKINIRNQFTLVNAPAGSGKTTAISNDVIELSKETSKKILCITYTNRAAEELERKIVDENVDISTIHSFISNFMRPFFQINEVVKFFREYYVSEIKNAISKLNENNKERYREKFKLEEDVEIDEEIVKENLTKIEYNEMQFSSWLYGGLSHDELLVFSREVLIKFPKVKKVLSQKYEYIFVDEYQDTHAHVLNMFYEAVLDTETKLILLGDKMQQIYNDRVDDFIEIIKKEFDEDYSLTDNWRSQEYIVDVLNNIYFDKAYVQTPQKPKGIIPKLHIVKSFDSNGQEGSLQLVLLNSVLFDAIGAFNLYNAYKLKYGFLSKYSPKDILLDMTLENPDDLITILVFITEICELYDRGHYGKLVQTIKSFKYSNKSTWKIIQHEDKINIKNNVENLKDKLGQDNINVNEVLNYLKSNDLINKDYIDTIFDNIKKVDEKTNGFEEEILAVNYFEFLNCYNEIKKDNPSLSTQHSVKGEGHDNVILNLEDSANINVKMYLFLKLFSNNIFDYPGLEEVNLKCKNLKKEFEYNNLLKLSKINKSKFNELEEQCIELVGKYKNVLNNHTMYGFLFEDIIDTFYTKINVTNFKEVIKIQSIVEGVIQAYKLFYVGCSRAKQTLDIFVLEEEIHEFQEGLIRKMREVGFECVPLETPIPT